MTENDEGALARRPRQVEHEPLREYHRRELLEQHGRAYAELKLAIAFTDGLDGVAAKIARNWKATKPLSGPDFAAALLGGRGTKRNPVVVLGPSNLIGIDFDGGSGRSLSRELVPGGWPKTIAVRSGRIDGGLHLWFRPPAGAGPAKIELSGDGLEIARDGYLVCPPSLHANGRPYTFA